MPTPSEQDSYDIRMVDLTIPESDWSFLPKEIPKGVDVFNMPYIRFVAEAITKSKYKRDLEIAFNSIDGMSDSRVRQLYAQYRRTYSPPQSYKLDN